MNKLKLLVAVTMLSLVAADAKDDAAKAELKKLEGTWRMESVTADGTELLREDIEDVRLAFKADGTWALTVKDPSNNSSGTFTVDPSKTPKATDFDTTAGAQKGTRTLDIYEFTDADTMRICYVEFDPAKGESRERPTKFTSEKGTGHVLVVMKRLKAD
jgi:uncharacterized protein (TIGR03067 family)